MKPAALARVFASHILRIAFVFCLFACAQILAFGQYSSLPQYAKASVGWQWNASSDGITYISVCWENSQGYSTETQWVQNAIENTWERVANVDFYNWRQCASGDGGIRILITDTRSNSRLGTGLDGLKNGMELNFMFKNFSPSCQATNKRESCIKTIAVHEFGHALGFEDEDKYESDNGLCNHTLGENGWKLSNSDRNSVMNYCNRTWNNNGELSTTDIKDVQTIYGAKTVDTQGQFLVIDLLDTSNGQVWENIVMDFANAAGGTRQLFHVNPGTTKQTRSWNFPNAGQHCYKVWSYTMYRNGQGILGYGEGCVALEKGGKYTFNLVQSGVNQNGYLILKLQNAANTNQIY